MPEHHQTPNLYHFFPGWKLLISSALVSTMLLASSASAVRRTIQNQNQALPVLDINKTEHNFGDVFVGEEVIARFTVRNLGAAPLLLSETRIAPASPTVGLYRESWQSSGRSVKELAKPAGIRKGALPYT
jgi:hypothetical protein